MVTKITGWFDNRESAETVVERLVQEYQLDRNNIEVTAAGNSNTAGKSGTEPAPDTIESKIVVSVKTEDQDFVETIRDTFVEFGATEME